MKTYLFNGKHYGGGKSSGLPGLGWMVYDIIKNWADNKQPASFDELTAAFPQDLRGSSARAKDALFAPKQDAENRPSPRHVHKNRRFFVIATGDGSEYAVSKEWGDLKGATGDIVVFVEHARGMGYDIKEVADEQRHSNARRNNSSQAAQGQPAQKQGGRGHKKSPKGRYGVKAMGDAQNIFVRHILGNLGNEPLSENDWEETRAHFGGRCVYCGEAESKDNKLVIDHAVPINRKAMGEHRLGNIVPSCDKCNKKKHSKDYRDFLADNAVARQAIEDYMQSRGYVPLESHENAAEVRELLEDAYRALEPLAKDYIRKLNEMLKKAP